MTTPARVGDGRAAGIDGPPMGLAGRIAVVVLVVPAAIIGLAGGYGFLAFVPYAAVGGFLVSRRPHNSIGWLLIALAWAFAASSPAVPATMADLRAGTASPPVIAIAVVSSMASGMLLVLYFVITIVFPNGRLPTGRWGRLARVTLTVVILVAIAPLFGPTITVNISGISSGVEIPNPLAVFPDLAVWSILSNAGAPIVSIAALAGVGSMVIRLRRAQGIERAQLRWLVLSMASILVGLVIGLVGDAVFDNGLGGLVWIPAEIAFVLPPIAIGIAVLRYRLYEIDRIVSRTISYATVTGILVIAFGAAILLFQAGLAPLTNGNTIAVAGSTLIVAALFQPLRRRVQTQVDRRFNRARYDAERTVAAFAGRLRDEVDLDEVSAEITATVSLTIAPAFVLLWLRGQGAK